MRRRGAKHLKEAEVFGLEAQTDDYETSNKGIVEMATELQVEQELDGTVQSITDEKGNTSALALSTIGLEGEAISNRQVFISHAEEDADFANRLADDLMRLGMPVWIAPESILPGESWVRAIERGLRESSHMVIALTPAAVESQWVEKETDVAIARERKGQIEVIPLDVKPCQLPLLLSSYQMVSFRQDYDAGLSQLAGRLGLRIEPSEVDETEKPKPTRSRLRLLSPLAGLLVLMLMKNFVTPYPSPSKYRPRT